MSDWVNLPTLGLGHIVALVLIVALYTAVLGYCMWLMRKRKTNAPPRENP